LVCPGLYCLTSELVPRVDSSAGAHAQLSCQLLTAISPVEHCTMYSGCAL
jgi:hypothetical protein